MAGADTPITQEDPFELRRFVSAQEGVYDGALGELQSGRKRTHWMWYIFPQLDGLDTARPPNALRSGASQRRKRICTTPCSEPDWRNAPPQSSPLRDDPPQTIFGFPDDVKLPILHDPVCGGPRRWRSVRPRPG